MKFRLAFALLSAMIVAAVLAPQAEARPYLLRKAWRGATAPVRLVARGTARAVSGEARGFAGCAGE